MNNESRNWAARSAYFIGFVLMVGLVAAQIAMRVTHVVPNFVTIYDQRALAEQPKGYLKRLHVWLQRHPDCKRVMLAGSGQDAEVEEFRDEGNGWCYWFEQRR